MNREAAQRVVNIMRGVSAQIDDSIRIVMNACEQEEFHRYRRVAGGLMGEIFLEVLEPLYTKYPELTPPELRQDRKDCDA